jgi:hypothetical protein
MMKKFEAKRLIALILALITLTLVFVSCANTPDDPTDSDNTTAAATDPGADGTGDQGTEAQTDEWGRPYVESPTAAGTKLADGTIITVLMRDGDTWNRELYAESESGDMLNDEIYKRNTKLEESLNFKFEFIKSPTKEDSQRTIIAEYESGGSSGLDLVLNYAFYSTGAALRDCYENIYDIETMNVDHPWWNQTYVEAATIQDQLYFIIGDLNLSVVDRSLAIYYNATMANEFKLGNLYDVVLDDKWTIDLLLEYTKDTWVDTNQSGTIDLPDRIGIISILGSEAYDGFLTAFGIDVLAKKDDGLEIVWNVEKVSKAIDYQITLFKENNGAFLHSNHTELCNKFTNDESLFWLYTIYASSATNQALRSMDSSYGLLPIPKYDLEQEEYYTTAQDAYGIMSVMATSAQLDAVGTVFEEWNYRSYMDILPVYCEVIMKTRYLNDVESGMIFDLILDSIKFDTGMVYGSEIDSIATSTRSIVKSGNNTFSKEIRAKKRAYDTKISKLVADFAARKQ